ncbi:MAG: hypothetical protein ACRDHL_03970 [Candidatus Promineifilaceae bacterium]
MRRPAPADAAEILRHHASQLEIHSQVNGSKPGTTVRFHLPMARPAQVAHALAAEA